MEVGKRMDVATLQTSPVQMPGLTHVTSILFVGKRSLSSELLSDSISRAFDVDCQIRSPIDLPNHLESNDLVLFNYADIPDELLRELLDTALHKSADAPVAIVN